MLFVLLLLVLSACTFSLYLFSSGVKGKLSGTLPGSTDYRGKELLRAKRRPIYDVSGRNGLFMAQINTAWCSVIYIYIYIYETQLDAVSYIYIYETQLGRVPYI